MRFPLTSTPSPVTFSIYCHHRVKRSWHRGLQFLHDIVGLANHRVFDKDSVDTIKSAVNWILFLDKIIWPWESCKERNANSSTFKDNLMRLNIFEIGYTLISCIGRIYIGTLYYSSYNHYNYHGYRTFLHLGRKTVCQYLKKGRVNWKKKHKISSSPKCFIAFLTKFLQILFAIAWINLLNNSIKKMATPTFGRLLPNVYYQSFDFGAPRSTYAEIAPFPLYHGKSTF